MRVIQQTPPSELEPGMVLGLDLCDAKGHRLMARGTKLTAQHITLLQKRDVASVPVEIEVVLSPEERARRETEIGAALDHQFRHVAGNPLMDRLKQVFLEYRRSKL